MTGPASARFSPDTTRVRLVAEMRPETWNRRRGRGRRRRCRIRGPAGFTSTRHQHTTHDLSGGETATSREKQHGEGHVSFCLILRGKKKRGKRKTTDSPVICPLLFPVSWRGSGCLRKGMPVPIPSQPSQIGWEDRNNAFEHCIACLPVTLRKELDPAGLPRRGRESPRPPLTHAYTAPTDATSDTAVRLRLLSPYCDDAWIVVVCYRREHQQ